MSRQRANPAWFALGAALALYALLQVYPLLATRGGWQNDFKHLYVGSYLLWTGGNPYDEMELRGTAAILAAEDARLERILPYVYLPFTGLVLGPLSKMPFGVAVQVWLQLNHLLLLGGLALAAWAGGWRWEWKGVALLGAAVAFNYTVFRQNSAGQLNAVLFFGAALLYIGIVRQWKPWLLGLIAALLMLFKITPGIFLIYFLLTRRWREAVWMAGWAALMMGACLLVVGWSVHAAFLPLLAEMGFGQSTWAHLDHTFWRDPYNQSVNSFLHHVLVPWEGFRPWIAAGAGVANALSMAFALGVLGVLGWRLWAEGAPVEASADTPRRRPAAGFSMAVMASLLVPSLMWDHYLVQALLPAVLLWNAAPAGREPLFRGLIAGCVALFSLGIEFGAGLLHPGIIEQPLALLSGGTVRLPALELPGWEPARSVLMSLKLWPAIGLFGLAVWASIAGAQPNLAGDNREEARTGNGNA